MREEKTSGYNKMKSKRTDVSSGCSKIRSGKENTAGRKTFTESIMPVKGRYQQKAVPRGIAFCFFGNIYKF